MMDSSSSAVGGRYVIRRELGRGAAATVFLADDTRMGEVVALKLLRRELVDSVGAERFHREIGIVAQLRHPNIVPILDSGEIDGTPFFTMPYLEDGTLAAKPDGREVPISIHVRNDVGAEPPSRTVAGIVTGKAGAPPVESERPSFTAI
jgi:serine/threonine-protein kinase